MPRLLQHVALTACPRPLPGPPRHRLSCARGHTASQHQRHGQTAQARCTAGLQRAPPGALPVPTPGSGPSVGP
eukprot:2728104-Lingulodinium_polyedra.AAC.1